MKQPPPPEQSFIQAVKSALDREQASLDGDSRRQLLTARRQALAGRRTHRYRQPAGLLGLALAAGLAAVVLLPRAPLAPQSNFPLSEDISLNDLELLGQLDDFDNEFEFYYWTDNELAEG